MVLNRSAPERHVPHYVQFNIIPKGSTQNGIVRTVLKNLKDISARIGIRFVAPGKLYRECRLRDHISASSSDYFWG